MGIRSGADDFKMCNKLKGEVIICLRGFLGENLKCLVGC